MPALLLINSDLGLDDFFEKTASAATKSSSDGENEPPLSDSAGDRSAAHTDEVSIVLASCDDGDDVDLKDDLDGANVVKPWLDGTHVSANISADRKIMVKINYNGCRKMFVDEIK